MTKSNQIKTEVPVYHELKHHFGHYERVYWPLRKAYGYSEDKTVCVRKGAIVTRPNGTKIEILSIFQGKMYPMVNYKIEGQEKPCSTSLHWFAYNIVGEDPNC